MYIKPYCCVFFVVIFLLVSPVGGDVMTFSGCSFLLLKRTALLIVKRFI